MANKKRPRRVKSAPEGATSGVAYVREDLGDPSSYPQRSGAQLTATSKLSIAEQRKLLERIRRRYSVMVSADRDNRQAALEDLRFANVPGAQWDRNMVRERGERPCYEFNKLRISIKRVINDIRANRPQGKVRPVEGGDRDTAEIYEGLIRNIWNASDGDTVLDSAAQYQVAAGFGAWRIATRYASDSAFEQDIWIEPIANPFCLYADPAAKDLLKRDARDWILTEKISKSAYKERWPNADAVDFSGSEFDDEHEWFDEGDDGLVRTCEYWYKQQAEKELWQLADGKVIEADSPEARIPAVRAQVKRTRTVLCHKIMMVIASGDAILEGPFEWAGTMFPFVPAYGEYMIIDGRVHWFGMVRFAKDAQRSYNVARTSVTETIALAPQFKWWATPEQAKGHTDAWAEAHRKNFPFMLYNPDAASGGSPPQSMGGPQVPVALIQEATLASDELKAVTGIFDASLGSRSNESSGVAIQRRQAQGEIANFNFQDNIAKAMRLTWEILIDLIPRVYDTERELRVLGADGAEDYVKVNTLVLAEDGETLVKVNDLARGRYDVTVTVGPSFTTQREEATQVYTQLGQHVPQLWAVAGDLIMKSMDLPYAEDIAERMRALLPPEVQQQLQQGADLPPEVAAAMQQAQAAMMQVQQQGELVQRAAAELDEKDAETQKTLADFEVKKAQFEARVAKALADLQRREAELTLKQAKAAQASAPEQLEADREALAQALAAERAALTEQLQRSLAAIQQEAAGVLDEALQTLQALAVERAREPPPQRKLVHVRRVGGELLGEVVAADGTRQHIRIRRINGQMAGEIVPEAQEAS